MPGNPIDLFTVLLLLGIVYSVRSAFFLLSYNSIQQEGKTAIGEVVSFERYRSTFFRSTLYPIIRFKTEDDLIIEGAPNRSAFTGLISLEFQNEVTVYYQESNPQKFVIAGRTEVWVSQLLIGLTLCGLVWAYVR